MGSPRSSGETLIGCSATEQTAQGPAGQSEPPAESQVMECDQPVSLEAEAADENVEVCNLVSPRCELFHICNFSSFGFF